MAAVLGHELVLERRWIEDTDFMAELSTAAIVPGAIAVNMAFLQGR
jgi:chromate transport protein ChrA